MATGISRTSTKRWVSSDFSLMHALRRLVSGSSAPPFRPTRIHGPPYDAPIRPGAEGRRPAAHGLSTAREPPFQSLDDVLRTDLVFSKSFLGVRTCASDDFLSGSPAFHDGVELPLLLNLRPSA